MDRPDRENNPISLTTITRALSAAGAVNSPAKSVATRTCLEPTEPLSLGKPEDFHFFIFVRIEAAFPRCLLQK
jgi:hypothetical protein